MQHFFKFEPRLKRVLWGGTKILGLKGIECPFSDVGESWEISGLKNTESVIANGELAGKNINELVEILGDKIVGKHNIQAHGSQFPLLIKLIDASKQLSIQVHPDDVQAMMRHGESGKDEMWYIIDSEPQATIISGLSRATSKEEFEKLMATDRLTSILAEHKSHTGDVFFLPARRIHSIGAGNLVLEVQQPCDITYRVYDFNRTDANGNKRPLQTQLAAETINFSDVVNGCDKMVTDGDALLVESPKFSVERIEVKGKRFIAMPQDSFLALTCINGSVELSADDGKEAITLRQGESALVAACTGKISADGNCVLITAYT